MIDCAMVCSHARAEWSNMLHSLSFAACIGVRYSVGLSCMFDRSAIFGVMQKMVAKMVWKQFQQSPARPRLESYTGV